MAPKLLLTLSMKGGVGKTTITVGLARILQARGLKVALLDLDIHGSALPRALKLARDPGYEPQIGGLLQPVVDQDLQIFSIGLLFRQESPNMWDGEQKRSAVEQLLCGSIAWSEDLEWLLVDTPPTSGDEVQALLKYAPNVHGALIVTQPSDLSALGLAKTLNLLAENQVPIVGALVNMAGYTCPHCQRESQLFDRSLEEIQELCDASQVPYLGAVPLAAEAIRQEALEPVADWVLSGRVVSLTDPSRYEGGARRWLLNAVK